MAPARKKTTNIARRRRLDDEDENHSVATLPDDSQSDASVLSDAGDDADADNSDLSEVDSAPSPNRIKSKRKTNGIHDAKLQENGHRQPSPTIARSDANFDVLKDTEINMNSLEMTNDSEDAETVDFDTGRAASGSTSAIDVTASRTETLGERRRREHEEYKKKRDSDPAFIPNRGAFFMHDQRHAPAQNGFRSGGGRGRGRDVAVGGPFLPGHMRSQAPEATDSPWQHDLHDTINIQGFQSQSSQGPPTRYPTQQAPNGVHHTVRAPPSLPPKLSSTRNFSTTVHTHNAMVRVFLPNMKAPIQFQNVPIKQHTCLPNHRPPLRRDKPVRISLPPATARYIFPTVERSFIFIPRALRPNQRGFGRGRGRFGSFGGGFSSRRTSVYGGSVYSPSVAMSRRSSIAREMGRDTLVSPAGSTMSRNGGYVDPSRPVVRLPPGDPRMPSGPGFTPPSSGTPSNAVQPHYPLPQKPTYRENWQGQLLIHQPRPQKTVSVVGIESPSMSFNPPQQQEQQPFHQQVPLHMNGAAVTLPVEPPPFHLHGRQLSYTSQLSTGTPLSNIPERAIHAPAFQPYVQPGFPPQPFIPQNFYYAPNGAQSQYVAPASIVPIYIPGPQQAGYMMPTTAPPAAPPAPAVQPNMVAYESNGMTYYLDSANIYPQAPMESYAQPSYTFPGMGGTMTPGPDGAYYYPQQMQAAPYYTTR